MDKLNYNFMSSMNLAFLLTFRFLLFEIFFKHDFGKERKKLKTKQKNKIHRFATEALNLMHRYK